VSAKSLKAFALLVEAVEVGGGREVLSGCCTSMLHALIHSLPPSWMNRAWRRLHRL
jgi:hypothetical protein